jgi:hypothetical protein
MTAEGAAFASAAEADMPLCGLAYAAIFRSWKLRNAVSCSDTIIVLASLRYKIKKSNPTKRLQDSFFLDFDRGRE